MRLIKPSYQILTKFDGQEILRTLEQIGRICYKSEDKITEESNKRFCKNILQNQHLSVIEHISLSVKFIIDTGVSHELVRHRLCSFSQESSRYCSYKGGVSFIIPSWIEFEEGEYSLPVYFEPRCECLDEPSKEWFQSCYRAEKTYLNLLKNNWTPQKARAVLPKCLKTEIITTCNLREWKYLLSLRTSSKAHPDMQMIMKPLLHELKSSIPIIFDSI